MYIHYLIGNNLIPSCYFYRKYGSTYDGLSAETKATCIMLTEGVDSMPETSTSADLGRNNSSKSKKSKSKKSKSEKSKSKKSTSFESKSNESDGPSYE